MSYVPRAFLITIAEGRLPTIGIIIITIPNEYKKFLPGNLYLAITYAMQVVRRTLIKDTPTEYKMLNPAISQRVYVV
ncbi:MAG: hypothetical protein L6V85_08665 [Clostridiales bacterium]|nr:MAG: hypothetical protein L6V85_08665 [Clostridiales bacterium]